MTDNTKKIRGDRAATDKHVLKIGTSRGHRGKVKNQRLTWTELIEKLSNPAVDNITKAQYNKLPVTEQVKLKNRGYFTSSQFLNGDRNIKHIVPFKSVITWDVDKLTVEQFHELINPDPDLSVLAPYEHFVYTTRSHTKERPRARVVLPLYEEVGLDAADAVSRILAERFDAKMTAVDPVSFRPAQIMYMPSVSADQKSDFITYRNRGKLLNAHADVLDVWDQDWKNRDLLPRGEREDKPRESMIGKVQHPTEKRGWVGAFCRTISVIDGLFMLSEFYEPAEDGPDPTRWSYIKGTSRGGVLVFPEDERFYSNHSSDPCYMQNLTIFDGFRIHLFGDLDSAEDEFGERDVTKSKSYLAMIEHIQKSDDFEDVRKEYVSTRYDLDAMADDSEFEAELIDDAPVTEKPAVVVVSAKANKEKLLASLTLSEKGTVLNTLDNIRTILRYDVHFAGAFGYNELAGQPVVLRSINSKKLDIASPRIHSRYGGDELDDSLVTVVRTMFSSKEGKGGWGLRVGKEDMHSAIEMVAKENRFHPVKRYLEGLKWDGVPRLATMLHDYFHVAQHSYHEQAATLSFVAAVTRIYEPGHKFDHMLVLEGPQGCGKSTAVSIFATQLDWFVEFSADPNNIKTVIENIQGAWIIEWSELSAIDRAESEAVKAMISGRKMTARMSYGRQAKTFKPSGVFFGTTNSEQYLRDLTGNRRFWPVKIPPGKQIDTAGLREAMPMIWAEAVEHYRWLRRVLPTADHLPLMLPPDAAVVAVATQEQRVVRGVEEIWEGQIHEWLETPVSEYELQAETIRGGHEPDLDDLDDDSKKSLRQKVCIAQVATSCLGLEIRRVSRTERDAIARGLNSAPGWKPYKQLRFGKFGQQKAWVREDL